MTPAESNEPTEIGCEGQLVMHREKFTREQTRSKTPTAQVATNMLGAL